MTRSNLRNSQCSSQSVTFSPTRSRRAFTLVELLTVMAIIGLIAVLAAPVLKHFGKSDTTEAASRQMLDDCARARQLAISGHSTVYMVFIPTNFWNDPFSKSGVNAWANNLVSFAPKMAASTIVTQMYGAQWTGYYIESLRGVGDQPGRSNPHDLQKVKTLPNGSFINPIKFTLPSYYAANPNMPFVVQSNYPMFGFLTASNIPFPSADVLTNPLYVAQLQQNGFGPNGFNYVTVPYIAFNYLGQLTPGDGSVLPYDEYIPLAYGSVLQYRDVHKANAQAPLGVPPVNVTESIPGASTNIGFNLIHIDRVTGRARLERQEAL